MGFNYVNVTSLSYIHLPKKFFLIFAGSNYSAPIKTILVLINKESFIKQDAQLL